MDGEKRDRRTKSVTIYDVAKEAGVAASTVSRALSRPGRVSEETADKVRAAAAKVGYRERTPSSREQQTSSRILLASISSFENFYFGQTLQGIEDEASEHGFKVLIADGRGQTSNERAMLEQAAEVAEAFVLVSPRSSDAVIQAASKRRPTVVINRIVKDVYSVVQNVPDGMRQVLSHLMELGHHSITYIAGPPNAWIQVSRWETLSHLAAEKGISVHRIGPYDPTVIGGLQAAEAWLENRTSAVVAYNDDMALGFMRTLLERGVKIPADVSVVGIDNSSIAPLYIPSLTSLAIPAHGQGVIAARTVIEMVGGAQPASLKNVVPMKLITRGSTGPAQPA